MPYIITTKTPCDTEGAVPVDSRAVATVQEARQRVFEIAEASYGRGDVSAVHACRAITDTGGRANLADGGTIEATRISWRELADRAGMEFEEWAEAREADILAAYNAHEAAR